jgi:hypothetical protein
MFQTESNHFPGGRIFSGYHFRTVGILPVVSWLLERSAPPDGQNGLWRDMSKGRKCGRTHDEFVRRGCDGMVGRGWQVRQMAHEYTMKQSAG